VALRQKLSRHFEANLPIEWDLSLKARRGFVIPPVEPLDMEPLALIREADLEQLKDPERLAEIVEAMGLSKDRPDYFPAGTRDLLGRGLRIWQYPHQVAPYLCEVGGREVETYLEVGVQHGGTFALTVEYLRRRGNLRAAHAVDFNLAPTTAALSHEIAGVQAHRMNSCSRRFRRLIQEISPIDLALIDGDHAAVGCMMDFCAVEDHARMIAFHDIVDPQLGVAEVWQQLRSTRADRWDFLEFTEQFPEIERSVGHPLLGIGLMLRR